MTGYKKMIRDRIPKTWDMALRYLKCKTKFIDYVYVIHVKKFNDNVMNTKKENNKSKEEIIKKVLNPTLYRFDETIKLEKLLNYSSGQINHLKDEYFFWNKVNTWVKWFCKNVIYIQNFIEIEKDIENKTKDTIVKDVSLKFGIPHDLSEFITTNLLC